ncbi:MAG TPA: rhodanese-like domain-containing protein [Phycisphaerae bacterium]|nr:rhodanese-like domain-containing protein [Phycisphaerae bacterium]
MRTGPVRRRYAVSVLIATLIAGCAERSGRFRDIVVERDSFAEQLAAPAPRPIVVIDVRDETAYDAGHIDGAIHVDAKRWKTESLADATDLTHIADWRRRIGDLGVNGDSHVVIYGDGRMTEASRVWFILQHFGVRHVAVLDGGYPALAPAIDAGRIRVNRTRTTPVAVRFVPDNREAAVDLANRSQLMSALDNPRVQILDTRTAGEFEGVDLRKNPRGGHIPGAINLPHKDLLNTEGRLKSKEELAELFRRAGFRKGRTIITHCQSGGRASLTALAAERAGYGPVMNYYKSFGEWSADRALPIVAPETSTGD